MDLLIDLILGFFSSNKKVNRSIMGIIVLILLLAVASIAFFNVNR
jgi:hypothetical protein